MKGGKRERKQKFLTLFVSFSKKKGGKRMEDITMLTSLEGSEKKRE